MREPQEFADAVVARCNEADGANFSMEDFMVHLVPESTRTFDELFIKKRVRTFDKK